MTMPAWNILVVLALAAATAAHAAPIHYDTFVTSTGPGSKLLIGGYDDGALTAIVPAEQMRVFGGEVVGSGTTLPFEGEAPGEPGFRAGDQAFLNGAAMTPAGVYTALAGATPLTFTFQPITVGATTRNLFFWNGEGEVGFAPVGGNVVLGLTKPGGSGWTRSISGTSSGVQSGSTIQNTGTGGTVHTHLFASIAKDGAAPDQGFYLYALQLSMTGYTSSDPIYYVFGALDPLALAPQFADLEAFEAAHGLAESWVDSNIAYVPEPATWLSAVAFTAAGIATRRRRRSSADRL